MRKGQVIAGYTITTDFKPSGNGKWSFANRGGVDYFIKEFLSPTYPTPDSPGSDETKKIKKARCIEFEKHHHELLSALSGRSLSGGNLVITENFFRERAKYYKVTIRIDTASLNTKEICKLPMEQRVLIAKTISHSLGILHNARIVHGDLKPENILIKKTKLGGYTAKLIDFDNSYFEGRPPAPEYLVGDQRYFSPEALVYLTSKEPGPHSLTCRSDIFSLGIVFYQYFTGEMPAFNREKYRYLHEAILDSETLNWDKVSIPPKIKELIDNMVSRLPSDRSTVSAILNYLKKDDLLSGGKITGVKPRPDGDIGKLGFIPDVSSPVSTVDLSERVALEAVPKLKGSLITKKGKPSDSGVVSAGKSPKISRPNLKGSLAKKADGPRSKSRKKVLTLKKKSALKGPLSKINKSSGKKAIRNIKKRRDK